MYATTNITRTHPTQDGGLTMQVNTWCTDFWLWYNIYSTVCYTIMIASELSCSTIHSACIVNYALIENSLHSHFRTHKELSFSCMPIYPIMNVMSVVVLSACQCGLN